MRAFEFDERFETMARESFVVLLPNSDYFERAKNCFERIETGLKAGGVSHLAVAGNRGVDAISLDKRVVAVGRTLGVPTSAGILPDYGEAALP